MATSIIALEESDKQALGIKFDEVKTMLRTLHTLTREMTPDGPDEQFRSSEALWCCAEQISRRCFVVLDDCTRMIGDIPMGYLDEKNEAQEVA